MTSDLNLRLYSCRRIIRIPVLWFASMLVMLTIRTIITVLPGITHRLVSSDDYGPLDEKIPLNVKVPLTFRFI